MYGFLFPLTSSDKNVTVFIYFLDSLLALHCWELVPQAVKPNNTNVDVSWKKGSQLKSLIIKMVHAYLWNIVFIVNRRRMSQPTVDSIISVTVGPGFHKKGCWASHRIQARKECSPVASVLVLTSKFLIWILNLDFFSYGLLLRWKKPSPSLAAFHHGVLHSYIESRLKEELLSCWSISVINQTI